LTLFICPYIAAYTNILSLPVINQLLLLIIYYY